MDYVGHMIRSWKTRFIREKGAGKTDVKIVRRADRKRIRITDKNRK